MLPFIVRKFLLWNGYKDVNFARYDSVPDQCVDIPTGIFFWNRNTEEIKNKIFSLRNSGWSGPFLLITVTDISYAELLLFIRMSKVAIINHEVRISALLNVIEDIHHKDYILDQTYQELAIQSLFYQTEKGSKFTILEEKILEAAKKGYSINKSAALLNLSVNTIASYRSRILKKTGARSIAELIGRLK